jgi:hypothetical protein
MKTQGQLSASGMSLFTSIYGFNRVTLVEERRVFVADNSPSCIGGIDREKIINCLPFVQRVFFFLLEAVFRAYPEVVPPGEGFEKYFFIPSVSSLPPSDCVASSALSQFAPSWTGLQVSRWRVLRHLLGCRGFLRLASDFRVSFGGGLFKRCNGG